MNKRIKTRLDKWPKWHRSADNRYTNSFHAIN